MQEWAVFGDTRTIEARSLVRLGFDRPDQRPFRNKIAAASATLLSSPGELLHGVYAHPKLPNDPVDVENVLTYNVDRRPLLALTTTGIVLERSYALEADPRFGVGLTPFDALLAVCWD